MNVDQLGKLMVGESFDNAPVNQAIYNIAVERLGRERIDDNDVEFYRMMSTIAAEGHAEAASALRK